MGKALTREEETMLGTSLAYNTEVGTGKDVDEEEDDVDEDKEHGEEDDMEEGELWLESVIPPSCEHMQCAVHTLQLAVNDGIKHATVEGLCGRSGVLQKKPSTQYRQADVEICQKGSTH